MTGMPGCTGDTPVIAMVGSPLTASPAVALVALDEPQRPQVGEEALHVLLRARLVDLEAIDDDAPHVARIAPLPQLGHYRAPPGAPPVPLPLPAFPDVPRHPHRTY